MIIAAPLNEIELRNLMYTAQKNCNLPFAIRYPRGKGVIQDWQVKFKEIDIGQGNILHSGDKVAVISIGHIGNMIKEITSDLKTKDINWVITIFDFLSLSMKKCYMKYLKNMKASLLLKMAV